MKCAKGCVLKAPHKPPCVSKRAVTFEVPPAIASAAIRAAGGHTAAAMRDAMEELKRRGARGRVVQQDIDLPGGGTLSILGGEFEL